MIAAVSSVFAATTTGPTGTTGGTQVVDKDWLTAAGATFLTVAVAILVIVFVIGRREQKSWLRTLVYLLAFAAAGFSLYLFSVDGQSKNEIAGRSDITLDRCLTTLDTISGLVDAKLISVNNQDEARAVAAQMRATLDRTECKRP
jgi:hypothetical protein